LQQVRTIVQSLSGGHQPDAIAKRATDQLVQTFNCAFARIWIVEPDRTALRLVASSGLYTHTNGFFSRVPMGAFKVGKIAQNRIPFLSNHLADEPWVKDREWAIAHQITGFAGYPLVIGEKVIGVLAVFSHEHLSPEFLEVLQGLCTTLAIVLENALYYQSEQQSRQALSSLLSSPVPLSEQLANLLYPGQLNLVGTEQPLTPSLTCILLKTAEALQTLHCTYCRLSYGADTITLEAMILPEAMPIYLLQDWAVSSLGEVIFAVSHLGGTLHTFTGAHQKVVQMVMTVPYPHCRVGTGVRIHCRLPLLQMAFTQLAYQAGLIVSSLPDARVPLLTDDRAAIQPGDRVLWLATQGQSLPNDCSGVVDLSMTASQLREAVETVVQGQMWGSPDPEVTEPHPLSEREQEILILLTQGMRDRDIANTLHISDRTVKFHINNILTKLNAKTRYQALHQSIVKGWIKP
jgi:GAF domain-containing protein/DNA-binding CsgD family transcriptional regulator